jgi:hypothetical protein
MPDGEGVMMRSFKGLAAMAAAVLLVVGVMRAAPAPGDVGAIVFQPADSYDRGLSKTFTAMAGERPEWITFFFRLAAAAEFSARVMETDGANGYRVTLDGAELCSDQLEYYLAYKAQGQVRYLPEDVPARFFTARASALPLPAQAAVLEAAVTVPRPTRFSLAFDGSLSQRLGAGDGPSFQQGENLRLAFQTGKDDFQVLFDARLQYGNVPVNGQKEFNFADGRLQLNLKKHSLQAGVLTLPGSELGLQPLGRRGVAYSFSNAAWRFDLFSLATQQLPGFEGIVVPRDGAGLFGASLSFFLLDRAVSVRATGLSGKDDPALGINTGFAAAAKSRKGDLLSLAVGAGLWKNSLALAGEVAASTSDADLTDGQPAISDLAWKVGGAFSRGVFELHASLKNIGKDFDSIGQQFMVSDRRVLDSGVGLRFSRVTFTASYLAQRNNVEDDNAVQTATDTQANAALSWDFAANASLQLGYARGELNLPATVLSPIGGGVTKEGYFGILSWRPGRSASLQVSAQRDVLSNAANPELDGRSLTLNAGWNFQRPDIFSISGQLGATQATYSTTQKENRFYYAFVNGEVAIVAKLLSLALTAAFNRSEPGSAGSQQTTSLDGGLVLRTPPSWKIGLVMAALRGNWLRSTAADVRTDDTRIYLKCDFSLGGR